jgi:hypothetical protein
MKNVTIRRCPMRDTIKNRTDELVASLQGDPGVKVNVVNGNQGEFFVVVDGQPIHGKTGDWLRDASEMASEIRGATSAV